MGSDLGCRQVVDGRYYFGAKVWTFLQFGCYVRPIVGRVCSAEHTAKAI